MAYLTEAQLLSFREIYREKNQNRIFKEQRKQSADVTIFLSHSHLDKKLVEGLISYLAQFGLNIYVDWQDSNMPRVTNRDTATLIKEKIKDLNLFWILATKNAMNSKWVPWETGIGDLAKNGNVYIIPVSDNDGKFHGSEYLQLYRRIEIANDDQLASFRPNQNSGGIYLKEVMKSRGSFLY
ncbi:toll/interleukin-1 receptor domain-containing protein [Leptospira dzoumogneensis]|uniref:TIR domain-containing protein n=1 Tax=Leptospira dzoumogneensis TaxID=2484904 RepID=A0A4Z1AMS8_9LEPT|nr:toll/interleukin-1 receptor domain-containing protein [Leptospira dzoumogneensis]TGN00310.1 TIR domain-containing protein [Leptospira dzoumogneensis]